MDESIEKQNEEMDGKKITERSKWMDEWLDRQKDGQFNR